MAQTHFTIGRKSAQNSTSMTLSLATLLVAGILIVLGAFQLISPRNSQSMWTGMLRSQPAAIVFMTAATAWFVWELLHLGAPDFGNHKNKLIVFFIASSFLSFRYIPDFLSVRGLAAFLLLASDAVLDAAYMKDPQTRLFLVTFVYLVIAASMYLASLPYRLRDFFEWLYKRPIITQALASFFLVYGLLLIGITFTY